jgi:hypothetical protein
MKILIKSGDFAIKWPARQESSCLFHENL